MNINKLFPSRFIKADDLGGKHIALTIARVVLEKVHGESGEEDKPIVYFKEAKKGLLINKTNAFTIGGLYGPETDNWTGKRITLYSTKVKAFGQTTDAVRIEDRIPPAPAPKANGNGKAQQPEPEPVPAALNEDVPSNERHSPLK